MSSEKIVICEFFLECLLAGGDDVIIGFPVAWCFDKKKDDYDKLMRGMKLVTCNEFSGCPLQKG